MYFSSAAIRSGQFLHAGIRCRFHTDCYRYFQTRPSAPECVRVSPAGHLLYFDELGNDDAVVWVETNNPLLMNERGYAIYFPLVVIGTMWVNDTMSIVGSLIGRTPLCKYRLKKPGERSAE